jgi:D,D-heptose 1,7-bisphosphate phosphatase
METTTAAAPVLRGKGLDMQLVILAGGKGARMGALTERLPKPMLPLAGKPILEHQVELARRYGAREIILLTGHLGQVIEDYFGDGADRGVPIRCHRESQPLGTAGAIKRIETWIHGDFLVFYGDILVDMDLERLADFHAAKAPLATLVVHPNGHPQDSDLLEIDAQGRVTAFHPKPREAGRCFHNLVNAALYVISPRLLRHVAAGQFSDLGRDVFPQIVQAGQAVYGYNTPEYLVDIGTLDRLQKVEADVRSGKVTRLNRAHPRRAVFLDRDGVLNLDMDHVRSPDQLRLLPGAAEAVRRINASEYLVVVVTNQPAIAKGFISECDLDRIHAKLETLLGEEGAYLDRIYYCPHHPDKGFAGERPEYKVICDCRKPAPGMLVRAAVELNIDLGGSFMVGDRTTDLVAGRAAGCKTILLGRDGAPRDEDDACPPDFICADLAEAVLEAIPLSAAQRSQHA